MPASSLQVRLARKLPLLEDPLVVTLSLGLILGRRHVVLDCATLRVGPAELPSWTTGHYCRTLPSQLCQLPDQRSQTTCWTTLKMTSLNGGRPLTQCVWQLVPNTWLVKLRRWRKPSTTQFQLP